MNLRLSKTSRCVNFLLFVASLSATLIFLEAVFSFWGLYEPPVPPVVTCYLNRRKEGGILSYYPNQECYQCYHRNDDEAACFDGFTTIDGKRFDCIRYHIGTERFRTPPFSKKKDGLRIVTIGDSFTFGEGVKEKDTFPRLLEESIGIETVNIAMQGLNTRHERLILQENMQLQPDLVIVGYVLNDTMPYEETLAMVHTSLRAARVPRVLRFSRVCAFAYARISSLLQSRKVLTDYHYWFKRGWPDSSEELLAIKDLCDSHKSELLLVLFPILLKLNDRYPFLELHREIGDFARRNEINFLDLLGVYKNRKASSLWVHELDHHPNVLAHKMACMAICQWIKESLPYFYDNRTTLHVAK